MPDGILVLFVLLVTALAVQPAWRYRVLLSLAAGFALFVMVSASVLAARPSWDAYVMSAPLHLAWRTVAVLAAATVAATIELKLTTRLG